MYRRREFQRQGLLALLFMTVLFAGCIFSPKAGDPPKKDLTYPAIDSEKALIENLRIAYQKRDYPKFASLFANDPAENAQYFFKPTLAGGDEWGLTDELRIHRRMFNPENPDPGDRPVPSELWLQSINISLNPQGDFVERTDLYKNVSNPSGLDVARFKASDAVYNADVFFNTAGELDYQVTGKDLFVVIMDRTKSGSEPGHFLILRWEDLGAGKPSGVTS